MRIYFPFFLWLMKNKVVSGSVILFFSGILLMAGFSKDPNTISKKDVRLTIPKGFPKPNYTFKNNNITPEGFVLGRMLFYDPILSKDSSISCGTCHQSFAAFAHIDHRLSHGIDNRIGTRNVPALQNLIWKDNFMWDGGINHLEVQPINPLTSPDEMNESLENILVKLRRSKRYRALFAAAYKDTAINTEKMLKSLAQFTGLMISANSKYDQYMRKETEFTEMEKKGMNIFMEKCNSCHTAPLFTNNKFADNGIGADPVINDIGRAKITGKKEDDYVFKVPSLRNVEITFPYMHDGRYGRLSHVLNHYGSLYERNSLTDPDLGRIGKLTESEKVELIAFLKTLTDKTFLYDRRFILLR
jgi:cytochrome c peroxidase